jgi:hypothetical protein
VSRILRWYECIHPHVRHHHLAGLSKSRVVCAPRARSQRQRGLEVPSRFLHQGWAEHGHIGARSTEGRQVPAHCTLVACRRMPA